MQKNGQSVVGNIKSKEGLKITKDWKKLNSPTLLDVDGKVRSLPTNSIEKIVGGPSYLLADSADLSYLEGKQPFFYQRKPIYKAHILSLWPKSLMKKKSYNMKDKQIFILGAGFGHVYC